MNSDAKAQVLETVESSAGSKRKVLSELGVSKATATAGEPDTGKEALRIEGIQVHPGTAFVLRRSP
ncbi:MAG TPA: hypothetical protein EYM27_07870 [Dehalococcoidia bacterium]|nr:hypothetical protein [Dehalococcoidia bacterium]